jgi:hypothetical protein
MVARGELHLSGIHQLAGHLTDENHEEVLRCAKHRSTREIERLIAEISPKPVRTSVKQKSRPVHSLAAGVQRNASPE